MMNAVRLCAVAAVLAPIAGVVVTEDKFVTIGGNTRTTTLTPGASTVDYTSVVIKESTIFVASTSASTSATGTLISGITTTKSNPVQAASGTSTTKLTAAIDPSTYTSKVVVGDTSSSSSAKTSAAPISTDVSASSAASSSSSTPSSSTISSSTTSSTTSSSTTAGAASSSAYYPNGNIMAAIDTSSPPSMFAREALPLTLPEGVKITTPLQTNKFFSNLLLDTQQLNAYCQPYNMFWSKDSNYYGFAVSYATASDRVFTYTTDSTTAEYFMSPLDVKSFVFSANEFTDSNMSLDVTYNDALVAVAEVSANSGSITFPLAIGMGFATGIYKGLTPKLFSQVGVRTVVQEENLDNGIMKYTATLFNDLVWNIYVTVPSGNTFNLTVNSNYEIVGSSAIDGLVIQVAVVTGTDDTYLDKAAGAYPVSGHVDASVASDVATYSLNYNTQGSSLSGSTFLYAFPHHVESFTGETTALLTDYKVNSRAKGYLQGVLANSLKMNENLYTDLQWLPYQPGNTGNTISADALQLLAKVVNSELAEDMSSQTDSSSTYTAGKALDKFAYILLVASEILGNEDVTQEGLTSLKKAFSPFLSNTQQTPFIYDTLCKGVTSSAAQTGNPTDDYGSPYYNDHHFHYGYHIHVAAVIGMLDVKYNNGAWVAENKDWVNSLIRDVANPTTDDTYFPVFRMFDFFNGHSWAAGMFSSADGKNEESTSEDYNFAYAMKLWGQVIGDKAMEARGDLMLAIMKRSLSKYFLYTQDNTIMPSEYIGNYVAGISYENKLDHTTFFGTNEEYIQGIQMIPITGASGLIRSKAFVQEEWDAKLSTLVTEIDTTWTNILRSNQVLINPSAAYQWFAADNFNSNNLDGGASRSWYLALAAYLGGSS